MRAWDTESQTRGLGVYLENRKVELAMAVVGAARELSLELSGACYGHEARLPERYSTSYINA